MRRAVFLDRDGVINRAVVIHGKPYPPANLEALEILPWVEHALQELRAAGWLLIVVTNQPDVARGTTSRAEVEAINQHLQLHLPIDEFRTCYHDSTDQCDCRKPSPGALLAAATVHNIEMAASFMVGDRWSDMQAGERAGCETIFIDCGYAEKQPEAVGHRVKCLAEAADIILGRLPEVSGINNENVLKKKR